MSVLIVWIRVRASFLVAERSLEALTTANNSYLKQENAFNVVLVNNLKEIPPP
jgi:hypothetical protein